jgi:hypothetical protein
MATKTIRPKTRDAILQALSAGVVPGQGLQYIQVGRASEVKALIRDINRVSDGGSAFRLIVGDYGAGKTFFLHVIRQVAMEHKLVTVHADFSPERRLVASNGQARNLYSELVANMSTRSRPEGGALSAIIEKFVAKSITQADQQNIQPHQLIEQQLSILQDYVGGYDMVKVLSCYCQGHETGNEMLKQNAIRWLRGEYTTKTEARQDLGVRTIIDDNMIYDAIRLLAEFMVLAGYSGLFVMLDEAVNLFKITNATSRKANYEMVLRILNNTLQGEAKHLGLLFGVTPEALYDPRRGLCSYDALASRLAPNQFAQQAGLTDFNQPTISLQSLSPEELFLLLMNIRNVFAGGNEKVHLIDEIGMQSFMNHCNKTIGAAYYKTPRETIRAFVQLLSMLDQYPDKTWQDFVQQVQVKHGIEPIMESVEEDDNANGIGLASKGNDDLNSFTL